MMDVLVVPTGTNICQRMVMSNVWMCIVHGR